MKDGELKGLAEPTIASLPISKRCRHDVLNEDSRASGRSKMAAIPSNNAEPLPPLNVVDNKTRRDRPYLISRQWYPSRDQSCQMIPQLFMLVEIEGERNERLR